MKLPKKLNICGKIYTVIYTKKPTDTDIYKRESLWGQIDYWTRTIRIYTDGRQFPDLLDSLMHEIIHGIATECKLKSLYATTDESDLTVLASMLVDTLIRNNFIRQDD